MNEEEINKNVKEVIKTMKKSNKESIKILEENNGGINLIITIPNLNNEEYEKWQLGDSLKNVVVSIAAQCNNITLAAFHNCLLGILDKFRAEHPAAIMTDMLGQFKSNLVIDEEDLKDES